MTHLWKILIFTVLSHCHKGLLPAHAQYQDPQACFMQKSFLTSFFLAGTVTWDCFVSDLSICLCRNSLIVCQKISQPVKVTALPCSISNVSQSGISSELWKGASVTSPWSLLKVFNSFSTLSTASGSWTSARLPAAGHSLTG